MKDDLTKKFKLPNYVKGKSFAEASKLIQDRFKDREDKISKDTMNTLLQRLRDAQEYIKQDVAEPTNDNFLGGMIDGASAGIALGPWGAGAGAALGLVDGLLSNNKKAQNELDVENTLSKNKAYSKPYAEGGLIDDTECGGPGQPPCSDTIKKPDYKYRPYLFPQSFDHAVWDAKRIWNSDTSEKAAYHKAWKDYDAAVRKQNILDAVRNEERRDSIAKVKKNKMSLGGLLTDPTDNDKKAQVIKDAENNAMNSIDNRPELNYGNFDKTYFNITDRGIDRVISPSTVNPQNAQGFKSQMRELMKLNPEAKLVSQYAQFNNRMAYGGKMKSNEYLTGGLTPGMSSLMGIDFSSLLKTPGINPDESKSGNVGGLGADLMRYAPIASNLFQLADMEKPQVETRDRLANRFNPNYVDTGQLQRIAENEYGNISNAIRDTSGGSPGTMRSNLLAASLNKTKGLGDAYMQADNINRRQDIVGQQFNMNVDRTNLSQSNLEKEVNARNQGAYDTNRSALIGSLGENIGGIGTELSRDEMIKQILEYNRRGEFIGNNSNGYGGLLNDVSRIAAGMYKNRTRKK